MSFIFFLVRIVDQFGQTDSLISDKEYLKNIKNKIQMSFPLPESDYTGIDFSLA